MTPEVKVPVSGDTLQKTNNMQQQKMSIKTKMPDCRLYVVVEINDIHPHIKLQVLCLFDLLACI